MSDTPDYIKDIFHLSKDNKTDQTATCNGLEKLARTKRSCSMDSFYTDPKEFEFNNDDDDDDDGDSDVFKSLSNQITSPADTFAAITTTTTTNTVVTNTKHKPPAVTHSIKKISKRRLSTPAALPSTNSSIFATSSKQLASTNRNDPKHNVQSNNNLFQF